MRSLSLVFILSILSGAVFGGGELRIGLFQGLPVERVDIVAVSGKSTFLLNDSDEYVLKNGETIQITAHGNSFSLLSKGKTIRTCSKLSLKVSPGSSYRLRPPAKKNNMRLYENDLVFYKKEGGVQIVMEIGLEEYVEGVVEAESGKGKLIEYYKVQAVISRTYALNNLRRHEAEGFHLCDATHCQVYHGISQFESLIPRAVKSTEDVVVVDSNIDLITATFHSNCGGHTVNSEEVWSKSVPYLVGRPDTFCVKMPNSQWEKKIPAVDWQGYLARKKLILPDSVYACVSPNSRQYLSIDSTASVSTKAIREDFKLKSTFFTVKPEGHEVKLMGRGFGHGVGLCQEGAMVMAGYGYTYKDIIHFYYRDVHLIPRNFIRFFAED